MGGSSEVSRREKKKTSPIIKIIMGSAVSVVLFFALIAIFSLIYLNTGSTAYLASGIISGAVSAFAGGFAAVIPIKEKGALFGAASGVISSLICDCIIFLINNSSAGLGMLILSGVMILFSCVGGIAAVNIKKKKKY